MSDKQGLQINKSQVFQVSLAEIAFLLAFLLLLLIGLKLASVYRLLESDAAHEARVTAIKESTASLKEAARNFDPRDAKKIVQATLDKSQLVSEVERLKTELISKEREFETLVSLKNVLLGENKTEALRDLMLAGKVVKEIQEKDRDPTVKPLSGMEYARTLEQRLLDDRQRAEAMEDRLEALTGRSNERPPCWGPGEFLFSIDLAPGGLLVLPSWEADRNEEVKRLPGVDELIGKGRLSVSDFRASASKISAIANAKKCYYIVRLDMSEAVSSVADFNRFRTAVNEHFYRVEGRGMRGLSSLK